MENKGQDMEKNKKNFMKAQKLLIELRTLTDSNSDKQQKRIKEEAWLALRENYDDYQRKFETYIISKGIFADSEIIRENFNDSFNDTMSYIIEKYQQTQGEVECYFNRTWKWRKIDAKNKIIGNRNVISLEIQKEEEGEEFDILDLLEDNSKIDLEETFVWQSKAVENLVSILNAINHVYRKRGKNEDLRLSFTDTITDICKNQYIDTEHRDFLGKEKSIFKGMNLDFLDFYMSRRCRKFKEIETTELKMKEEIKNRDVKQEGKWEHIEVPLENETYVLFLLENQGRKISDSRVSQIRSAYKELYKKIGVRNKIITVLDLCKEDINIKQIAKNSGFDQEFIRLLLQCFEEIVKKNKKWKKAEVINENEKEKLIEEITKIALNKKTELMIQQCNKIKEVYQKIKEEKKEEKIREEIRNRLQENFAEDFFNDWKQNFAEKFAYIVGKEQRIEEKLPEFLKQKVLEKFQEYLEEDPDNEKILLESLKEEFFRRKGSDGQFIYRSIEIKTEEFLQKAILSMISLEHHIDSSFVMDVLEYLQKKEKHKNDTRTLVLKIQEKHLYQYFWT